MAQNKKTVSDYAKRYKINVSENLYNTLQNTADVLQMKKQNLVMIMLINRLDALYPDILQGNYEKIKKVLQINNEKYASPPANADNKFVLQFEVYDVIDEILENLCDSLGYTKQKLIPLMLYKANTLLLDDITRKFKSKKDGDKGKSNFEIDRRLNCLGISKRDFERFSSAYVMFSMLSNMDDALQIHMQE